MSIVSGNGLLTFPAPADGDYDVLVAAGFNQTNHFFRNVTEVADVHPPYLPNVEQVGDQAAAAAPVRVRAHVYDNAPYYITWYNPTVLEVTVDGVALPALPARSSAGQVFRLPIRQASAAGVLLEPDFWALPNSSFVSNPSTWHFQAWHRDPNAGMSGFNVSTALRVPFRP